MQPWRIGHAALYGAMIGIAAAAFKTFSSWAEPHTSAAIVKEFIGAALGFALLCTLASLLRNFVVERLI